MFQCCISYGKAGVAFRVTAHGTVSWANNLGLSIRRRPAIIHKLSQQAASKIADFLLDSAR